MIDKEFNYFYNSSEVLGQGAFGRVHLGG